MSEEAKGLELFITPAGVRSRVVLNGHDISGCVKSVSFDVSVGRVTTATIEYTGAIAVTGEAGVVELRQAEHLVKCGTCQGLLKGEEKAPVILVDATTFKDESRANTVVR